MSHKPVHDLLILSVLATGTITAHRAVGYDGAQATVQGQKVKGVAVTGAASGEVFPVKAKGTEIIEAGAAIAAGDDIVADSQGRAIPAQAAISVTVTAITKANPGVVTAAGHGLATGNVVAFTGVGGMVELNNKTYIVTRIDADTFSIGVDSTGFTTFTAGGKATKVGPDGSAGHAFATALEAASTAGKFLEVILK